jgi:hypothetical protein
VVSVDTVEDSLAPRRCHVASPARETDLQCEDGMF